MIGLWAIALAAPYHSGVPEVGIAWRTIDTDHFAIHYMASHPRRPVNGEAYAQVLARGADALLTEAAAQHGQVPKGRLHVLVLDKSDSVDGYTLPHWDWIVLSAYPGTQLARTRGRSDGPLDALAHELGHVLSHKASVSLPERMNLGVELGGTAEGPWGGVGLRLEIDHDRPYGWSEGLAEWISEAAGVNHWSTERDAGLRVTALEDRWLTWAELQFSEEKGDFGDAERAYQQGYAFARWLARRYGPEIHAQVADAKRTRSWDGALRAATGIRGKELHNAFVADLNEHYSAQIASIAAAGLAEGEEVLSWQPPWRATARWSEDAWARRGRRDQEEAKESTGRWRLCPRLQDGWLLEGRVGAVVASRVDEGALSGVQGSWPAGGLGQSDDRLWIPATFGGGFAHGKQAAFVVGPVGGDWRYLSGVDFDHIWRVDLKGERFDRRREVKRRRSRVPGTERATDLAVSPDGDLMAWFRFKGGGQELVVGPIDGSDWRVVSTWGPHGHSRGLSWSPDGAELVTSKALAGKVDLWRVHVGSGEWTPLTDDRWVEQDPWWDEDGIWFSADVDGVADVFRWSAGSVVRVTQERAGAVCPSSTPEGNLLYTAPTAHGFKAVAMGRWRMHGADVSDRFELDVDEVELEALRLAPGPIAMPSRPYRAVRSMLPPSMGPFVRLDVSGAQVSPSVGAYATVSDAVEHHDLSLWGMVGDDRAAEFRYAYQGFWADLGVWGGTLRERIPGDDGADTRALNRGGVFAQRKLTEAVAAQVEGQGLRLARTDGLPILTGLRGTLGVRVDTLGSRLDDEGVDWTFGWTVGASMLSEPIVDQDERLKSYQWHRPWTTGRWQGALGSRGVLSDAPHRLELRGAAAWTSRHVFGEEALVVGGDTPWTLRSTALESTVPMPGYAPFAVRGDAVAVVGAAWALPIGPRWRAGGRGFTVRRVETVVGFDGGAVWRTEAGRWPFPQPLADVRGGLRLASVLRDARFDSQILVAAPLFDVGEGAAATGPVPGAADWKGPMRVVIGVGTGW